jgi:hypothetical protein
MTRTIETTLYKFDELPSDKAKEAAREWFRRSSDGDNDFAECVIDDAKQCAAILGIEIDEVYWCGFNSQGDGASFEGSYSYAKGAPKAIRKHAPQDTELARIADALQDIQRKYAYKLAASISQDGRYRHSGTMRVSVEADSATYQGVRGDADEGVRQAMRDFADWIYDQLERGYEWTYADEQVDENLRANEYEFDEDGSLA